MKFPSKRWQLLAASVFFIAIAMAAWFFWSRLSTQNKAGSAEQISQLTQRCQTAMLRDTCSVMKGNAPSSGQARLFIAGIGEVDAQAFASLKAAGDQMCGQLAGQCQTDWSGQACKIGRALYPDLTKPS
jgi:hypothetical protein